ncbi:MAG: DUF4239 domain-containing protein [Dactylosporangium sp.]|nr:DUF4239 domain-containing protein [Dactylosporangium sp.]NNJ60336.1 DUF4239 domain-containing protein [Dactylosporangium sp.]
MGLWLVRDVPSWLVALVVIGGVAATTVGLDHLIHQWLPHRRLGRYNIVTGIFVSIVGVAYGIIVGNCVVTLWDKHSEAGHIARQESTNLTALAEAGHVFGPAIEARLSEQVARYNDTIADGWSERIRGISNPDEETSLDAISDTVNGLKPASDAQRAFVQDAVVRIGLGRELRQQALDQASDQQIPGMLWFALGAATVGVLSLCLLFGLDDSVVRRTLLMLAALVVATNLFVVIQMNYPYFGSFSVGPGSYEQAAEGLRR